MKNDVKFVNSVDFAIPHQQNDWHNRSQHCQHPPGHLPPAGGKHQILLCVPESVENNESDEEETAEDGDAREGQGVDSVQDVEAVLNSEFYAITKNYEYDICVLLKLLFSPINPGSDSSEEEAVCIPTPRTLYHHRIQYSTHSRRNDRKTSF